MHHDSGEGGKKLYQIIPVRHCIHTVHRRPVKPKQACRVLPVQRKSGSCQSPRPQRTVIHPSIDIPKPESVPPEHLKIGAVMMGQRHRLGLLQVRESGHVSLQILLHGPQDDGEQLRKLPLRLQHPLPGIKPHVQSHLIVAAPACVKLLPCVLNALHKLRLHKAVDILAALVNRKPASVHILQDLPKGPDHDIPLLRFNDPPGSQHPGMGNAALDILVKKAPVKTYGRVKLIGRRSGLPGKTSPP